MTHPPGQPGGGGGSGGGTTGPGRPTGGKTRDAIILGLAQNAILAGLIIAAAGVPTW